MSTNPVPEWWFLGAPVSASERPSSQGDDEMTQTAQTETDPREAIWARYPNDALRIETRSGNPRCRSPKCQAPVWWGTTAATGKPSVFDVKPNGELVGTNHWRTCLDRERFKKR